VPPQQREIGALRSVACRCDGFATAQYLPHALRAVNDFIIESTADLPKTNNRSNCYVTRVISITYVLTVVSALSLARR